jgi:hypothetical protein
VLGSLRPVGGNIAGYAVEQSYGPMHPKGDHQGFGMIVAELLKFFGCECRILPLGVPVLCVCACPAPISQSGWPQWRWCPLPLVPIAAASVHAANAGSLDNYEMREMLVAAVEKGVGSLSRLAPQSSLVDTGPLSASDIVLGGVSIG